MAYHPLSVWRSQSLPPGFVEHPDVFLVPVSPPDEKGYCSFGTGVWWSKTNARNARTGIAEVQPDFIRTYGENYIHVNEIDFFVEGEPPPPAAATPPLSEEETAVAEVICSLVAAELIEDGNTIQVGIGKVSAAIGQYLDFRNDLGVHTEFLTGGIADLVERGVVTGKYKKLHPYKVVAAGIAALPREELEPVLAELA